MVSNVQFPSPKITNYQFHDSDTGRTYTVTPKFDPPGWGTHDAEIRSKELLWVEAILLTEFRDGKPVDPEICKAAYDNLEHYVEKNRQEGLSHPPKATKQELFMRAAGTALAIALNPNNPLHRKEYERAIQLMEKMPAGRQ